MSTPAQGKTAKRKTAKGKALVPAEVPAPVLGFWERNLYAGLMVAAITFNAILGAIYFGPENFGPFMWSNCGALLVGAAIYTRTDLINFRSGQEVNVQYQPSSTARHWVYWLSPILVTLVLSPLLLSGEFDGDMNPVVSMLLFLMLAFGAAGLGMVVTFLVMLPIEAIGVGVVRLVQGKREGIPFLGWGVVGLLVVAVGVASSQSVEGGRGAAMRAIWGLPGDYYVVSPGWLWGARLLLALLVAMTLTLVGMSQRERERSRGIRRDR